MNGLGHTFACVLLTHFQQPISVTKDPPIYFLCAGYKKAFCSQFNPAQCTGGPAAQRVLHTALGRKESPLHVFRFTVYGYASV